ncbi:hypothetical protein EB796_016491 [Bugula neritina]|uniref:Uncharacterized protein n=1 Tax=Bugula neritina TaxID=10212 RepID=A0A7J7JG29_BUGNE|nr:hypothetical protein EB796_016491 [Bugula neritina]
MKTLQTIWSRENNSQNLFQYVLILNIKHQIHVFFVNIKHNKNRPPSPDQLAKISLFDLCNPCRFPTHHSFSPGMGHSTMDRRKLTIMMLKNRLHALVEL